MLAPDQKNHHAYHPDYCWDIIIFYIDYVGGWIDMIYWIMGKVQLGKGLGKPQLEEIVAFLQSITGVIPEDALTIPLIPSME